ncbi:MAG: leucyl aminopeptidase [Hyphomonadaceae bacterium]|nr:leucyl aminopeptidase [Hyphomonadaceae bacterium]
MLRIGTALALVCAAFAATPPALAQQRGAAQAAAPEHRQIAFAAEAGAPGGVLLLPLAGADDLAARGAMLSEDERAAVARAIASARYEYGARATLSLRGIGAWDQIMLIGVRPDSDGADYQRAGAVAGRALAAEPGRLTVAASGLGGDAVAAFATGLGIGEYRSDLYHTRDRQTREHGPVAIVTDEPQQASALFAGRGRALIEAMAWTRDISNEPANAVYPETFVARARGAFRGVQGVAIQVLDPPAMERLGMGAILGVGRGSQRPPRMMIVRYRGPNSPEQPIVLAGKGITFDSGGVSIKPSENMGNMRMDMSGAASVTGAVLALSRSRAPVHVVAVAALAENMPDGGAIRPGDVLTAMNGMTIEVVSTDAEGRLVLADALAWIDANLEPAAVVDLATLTGAVRTALGDDYAGLFSRHDALAEQLSAAGDTVGERLWRLPLDPSYAADTASTTADIKNSGEGGAGAGAGAHFIGEFISRDIPWAHIDIAGVAYGGANDWKPAGSAGFGVRLLERFVRDFQPIPPAPETE